MCSLLFTASFKSRARASKTSSSGAIPVLLSQLDNTLTVRGRVSETMLFSTERNNISPIGAIKVNNTKNKSGAISMSALIFWRLNDFARLLLSEVPSFANTVLVSLIFLILFT